MTHWIIVASADHVARGVAGGFVQACHGKAGPLQRLRQGDSVLCYSPVSVFGGHDGLQAFTAIGVVADGPPYGAGADAGRVHRRAVAWTTVGQAPIRPLLGKLQLTAGQAYWGARFRYGLVEICARDAALIGVALRLAAARMATAQTPRHAA